MRVIRPIEITAILSSNATDPTPVWDSSTVYRRGRRARVSSTIYEALMPNLNYNPPDWTTSEQPVWAEVGPANEWSMFRQVPDLQTTAKDAIIVAVAPGQADAIGLHGVVGTGVLIEVFDSLDVELLSRSITLTYVSGDYNGQCSEVAAFDLGIPADGWVRVTINNAGSDAVCETMTVGRAVTLGTTEEGLSLSVVDYSEKGTNAVGITRIIERGYQRIIDSVTHADLDDTDFIHKVLSGLRTTPATWVSSDICPTILYGMYKDFEIELWGHAKTSLKLESIFYEVALSEQTPLGTPVYFTSKPYPYLYDDAFTLSGSGQNGDLFGRVFEPVEFSLGATAISANLREALLRRSVHNEANFDLSATAISATMRIALIREAVHDEANFSLSATAVRGNLYRNLIIYDRWPGEGFTLSATAIGATLS